MSDTLEETDQQAIEALDFQPTCERDNCDAPATGYAHRDLCQARQLLCTLHRAEADRFFIDAARCGIVVVCILTPPHAHPSPTIHTHPL
jgi:hypothetical protein